MKSQFNKDVEWMEKMHLFDAAMRMRQLKRDNAIMRRFFKARTWASKQRTMDAVHTAMPNLFRAKGRGSK